MQAKDVMSTKVVSISPAASVSHAVAVMMQNNVSGLPVVDDGGHVCGIVTEGDLLLRREIRGMHRPAHVPELVSEIELERYISSHGWRVADVMSRDVVVASPDSELADIAESLQAHRIRRLPIVDEGRLVGIVSRRDILALILNQRSAPLPRNDDAIRQAIRVRLQSDLGLPPQKVRVMVKNGQVTLEGLVESDLKRRAVQVLVESLAGIDGYRDRLSVSPAGAPPLHPVAH